MLTQVGAFLAEAPGSALLAAPAPALRAVASLRPEHRHELPARASLSPAEALWRGARAGRWARARGARLLHGHGLGWAPLYAAASAASGLPLVVTLHNEIPPLRAWSQAAHRALLGRAARVIAVSDAVAASIRPLVARERLVVIPNASPLAAERVPSREAARAGLGLPAGERLVFCAARLAPEKGLRFLIEAASALPLQAMDPLVWIAGEGPERASLERAIRALPRPGRIRLLGHREDVPALLAACDVFCLPSVAREGLPLAVLEAMTAGRPVVSTRHSGIPEAVSGDTGLLVPPGDAGALARALAELLADPARARALGARGAARAVARFSWSAQLAATREAYREALACS